MLRASCKILIKKLYEAGKISETRKQQCLDFITSERNHEKIRNLIAMILLPKKLHKSDESQSAFLRAAVSRVSCQETKFKTNYFRLRIQLFWRNRVLTCWNQFISCFLESLNSLMSHHPIQLDIS